MATLQKIRNKSVLLVGAIGLALFAFIIGDLLNNGSTLFNQRKETVLAIDGENIGIIDFQAKVAEMEEIYKMQTGSSSVSEEVGAQIRETVFETMIKDVLLGEASLNVGFTVSKGELSDLIMGDMISPMIQQIPWFRNPQTGEFDKNTLIQFLQTIESDEYVDNPQIQSTKNYWLFVEQSVKQQQLEDKYTNLIAKSVVTNSLDAKAAFDAGNVSVDFDYVTQLYSSVADDLVSINDEEVEKLYNKRKELFKQDGAVIIDYIAVDIVPSQDDFEKIEETLNKIKPELESSEAVVSEIVNDHSDVPFSNAFVSVSGMQPEIKNFVQTAAIGSVEGPILINSTYHLLKLTGKTMAADSVKINQMTLPQLDEQALTQLTDSLIDVINKGKSFSDLALELTGGQSNGDMGWTTELALTNTFGEKFKDEVFPAPLNKVFVAKSSYGTHLIQLSGRTSPVTKYKLADVQIEVTPSTETYKQLYNNLTRFVSANNNIDAFKSAAQEAGYYCNTEVTIGKNDQMIGTITSVRPLVRWAFDQKKGAISDIFEMQDKFVVAAVEGFQKEGYRPVSAVADILKRELLNQKKGEKIMEGLKDKQFESLEQYAEVMASSVQTVQYVNFATGRISGIGMEPVVSANAPLQEVGKISPVFQGDNGVYVLKVTDKRENSGEFNLESQKQMMDAGNVYRFRYQIMPTLKDKAEIEDNRIRFY